MSLTLEIECASVSIAQVKEGGVIVHDEHLLVGQQMVMRLNGQPVDYFFGDDVKKSKRSKDIVVKALDMVEAIRFSYGKSGRGRYVWESVREPVDLEKLVFEVYTLPALDGEVLEKVTYDGKRPDENNEQAGSVFSVVNTIPVTDAVFSKQPLLFE